MRIERGKRQATIFKWIKKGRKNDPKKSIENFGKRKKSYNEMRKVMKKI